MEDFFILPVLDQYLFYAPFYRFAKIIHKEQVEKLSSGPSQLSLQQVFEILPEIKQYKKVKIHTPQGELTSPLFLGLITTRGCNMACCYCDFPAPKITSSVMSMELARKSVDRYLLILSKNGLKRGQIEFFGGEPFFNNRISEFVLSYARNKSSEKGIDLQFKVTTNGVMQREKCEWVADNFDTVVLSLDGPANWQNKNRPLINGEESYKIAHSSAKILSSGSSDLIIRSCITRESVEHMTDIADWIVQEFDIDEICFEALSPSEMSSKNLIEPPDPYRFAMNFIKAKVLLEKSHIDLVTSGTNLDELQYSFCPVGKDAMIVSPEGRINACYLPEEEWLKRGFNLTIGQFNENPPIYSINPKHLILARSFNALHSPLCRKCFAQYHCAGGCHVHHSDIIKSSSHDRLCIQTRLIVMADLLIRMDDCGLVNAWMSSKSWQNPSEIQILPIIENWP